jgi:coenzyme F420-dependent glucose-6-phosphate dehydrogenase
MYEEGERQVSDEEFKEEVIIAADPGVHVERIREVEELGATIVALMNNSGADPMAAIETYEDKVLPRLTGSG